MMPAIDDRLTIDPPPLATIAGIAYLMPKPIVIVTHELASIFAVGNNNVFLDAETKTQIALGDPKRLLAECPNPIEEFRSFEPSSLRTLRWREMDSNRRSPAE